MESLSKEDLQQLLSFFKQKTSDLEFSILQNQLLINKINQENQNLKTKNSSLQSKVDSLTNEIQVLLSAQTKKAKSKNKE